MRDPCLDPLDQNSPGEQIPICLNVTIYGDLCDGPPFDIDFDHSRQADRPKHADPGHWPDVRCFDIERHFYASVLIRAGLSVRVVADRLGHADASMTLNVYAHLWPDEEDRTRSAVDSMFGDPADQVRTDDPPQVLSPAAMPLLRRSAGSPG